MPFIQSLSNQMSQLGHVYVVASATAGLVSAWTLEPLREALMGPQRWVTEMDIVQPLISVGCGDLILRVNRLADIVLFSRSLFPSFPCMSDNLRALWLVILPD
jgi:hypothetical protein